jgi:hypothetical protein
MQWQGWCQPINQEVRGNPNNRQKTKPTPVGEKAEEGNGKFD